MLLVKYIRELIKYTNVQEAKKSSDLLHYNFVKKRTVNFVD